MKSILLVISVGLLVSGTLKDRQSLIILGAIIFLSALLTDLIGVYRLSKHHRDAPENLEESPKKRNILDIIAKWLEGIIMLYGLIAFMVGVDDKQSGLFVPGAIIWVGAVASYFIGGVIVQYTTGIPMRFWYGGWYI